MKALPSLPLGVHSLSSPTPVSYWDKPGTGGYDFLHFATDVANVDLPMGRWGRASKYSVPGWFENRPRSGATAATPAPEYSGKFTYQGPLRRKKSGSSWGSNYNVFNISERSGASLPHNWVMQSAPSRNVKPAQGLSVL